MKNKLGKYEKGIILAGIVVIIIMLILLTADEIKNIRKDNTPVGLSEQGEHTTNEPNIPVLSAGMIPVKYEGENLVIAKNDNSWYSYTQGTPAYMMLNDGVYQSELVVDMTGKKLASENIGETVTAEEQGSIYMWLPRYEINEKNEIKYVKEINPAEEGYEIPETFMYKQETETSPDFLLTGVWVEKTPLASTSAVNTKITNMTGENNTYGFIANTVAINANTIIENPNTAETDGDNPWLPYARELSAKQTEGFSTNADTNPVGGDICALDDETNTNRTILKIINTNKVEPIKAKAEYNGETGQIEIQVTYNKNGIAKILDEEGNTLSEDSLTANTGNKEIENGKYLFTVIDNKGNRKKINITVTGIIPSYYGKVVTNYNCEVEGITWRIFYKDDENIYLIADDYVPYKNLPTSTAGKELDKGDNTDYNAYFTNILNDYTGSAWIREKTNEQALKWLTWVNSNLDSTNKNIKAVAYMMDTESWSTFAGDEAEYAIGGPTLELFCASYKVTHPDKWIECIAANEYGYKVKWSNKGSYTNYISELTEDDFDSIYIKSDTSKANGMWLASPSANNANSVRYVGFDGYAYYCSYGEPALAFRPVVCLNSETELHNNGDGTYSIKPAIEAKATYDETAGEVKIEVTYNKNKIVKILDEEGNILSENSITATTGKKEFENRKTYIYTILDEKGNKKHVKCKPVNSILYAKDIIKEDYGQVVDNYTCANTGVSTWRIFHTDDENIYLIADDYVPYGNLPKSTAGKALNKGKTDYKAYFTNILSSYSGSAWIRTNTNPKALKWLTWVNNYQSSTHNGIKAVAYMMDTKSWSTFAGDKAEYAIGGPTLELFCASYKVTHPDAYMLCDNDKWTSTGYKMVWSNNDSHDIMVDDYKSIYFKSDEKKTKGMWLASTIYDSDNRIFNANCGGYLGDRQYDCGVLDDFTGGNPGLGFRPVVCLQSEVGLLDNGNGTFSIQ